MMYGSQPWDWNVFLWHLFLVVVYGLVGIALFSLAFLIIKVITPFSIRKEIEEDQNTSLAIVLGSIFVGIAIILAAAIVG